jgi:DnaJ-class molecular chaperone
MTIKNKDLSEQIDITVNPEKYGYMECPDCDGYGGTIRNSDIALQEICGECGGDGVIPKPEKEEKTDDDDQG